jgi:hypothetical protein
MSDTIDVTGTLTGIVGTVGALTGEVPYVVAHTPLGDLVVPLVGGSGSAGTATVFGVPVTYQVGYGTPPPSTLASNLLLYGAIALGAIFLLK